MQRRTVIVSAIAAAVLVTAGGVTYASARGSGDQGDNQTPIENADLVRASAAALAQTGGGRVTGTEVGDEESYYEVEVTMDGGRQVDVQLDDQFRVVGGSADREDPGETGG